MWIYPNSWNIELYYKISESFKKWTREIGDMLFAWLISVCNMLNRRESYVTYIRGIFFLIVGTEIKTLKAKFALFDSMGG